MIAEARRLVEDGARKAGRTVQELPLIFMSPFHVDKDMATARAWGREWLMESGRQLVAWGAPYWFRAAGLDVFDHWAPEKLSDERLTQVLDAVGLFGTPEYCAKRLRYMAEEADVNHVFLLNAHRDGPKDTSYDLPQDELDALRDVIIPMLRTLD